MAEKIKKIKTDFKIIFLFFKFKIQKIIINEEEAKIENGFTQNTKPEKKPKIEK